MKKLIALMGIFKGDLKYKETIIWNLMKYLITRKL